MLYLPETDYDSGHRKEYANISKCCEFPNNKRFYSCDEYFCIFVIASGVKCIECMV